MIVVADATPLLHLVRIGRVALVERVFGGVLVLRTVWAELVEADPEARGVGELQGAAWIRVTSRRFVRTVSGWPMT